MKILSFMDESIRKHVFNINCKIYMGSKNKNVCDRMWRASKRHNNEKIESEVKQIRLDNILSIAGQTLSVIYFPEKNYFIPFPQIKSVN